MITSLKPVLPAAFLERVAHTIATKDIGKLELLVGMEPQVVFCDLPSIGRGTYIRAPFAIACLSSQFHAGIALAVRHGLDVDTGFPEKTMAGALVRPKTLLIHAIERGDANAVRFLVALNANLAAVDHVGTSPLCAAWFELVARRGDYLLEPSFEIMNVLLDHDAPWIAGSGLHRSPIATIASTYLGSQVYTQLSIDLFEKGIRKGWDLNAQNAIELPSGIVVRKYNALEATLEGGGKEMMLALIHLGANVQSMTDGRDLLEMLSGPSKPQWTVRDYPRWIPEVTTAIMRARLSAESSKFAHACSSKRRSHVF